MRIKQLAYAISLIGATGTLSAIAFADDGTPPVQKVNKIEVTGSNIKRVEQETAAPVQVITHEEIMTSGATSLMDVIKNLSANNSGTNTGVELSSFTPGVSSISLRGLGSQATLVLVNGRRIANYGVTSSQSEVVNIDAIPKEAVQRIEVLKDGASAIYGSEAIAGVVNIILRSDYHGFEATAQTGFADTGGAHKINDVSFTTGYGDIAADRFNVMLSFEHRDSEAMTVSQSKWYNTRDYRTLGVGLPDQRSSYSYPGNVLVGGKFVPNPGCPTSLIAASGRCVIDLYQYYYAYPQSHVNSVYTRGEFQLNADTTLFAEFGYNQNKSNYQFDPQFYYNTGSSTLQDSTGNEYRLRTGDVGARRFSVDDKESRAVLGIKGSFGDWNYDSAVTFLESKVGVTQTGLILQDEFEDALGNPSSAHPSGGQSQTYFPGQVNPQSVISKFSRPLYRTGDDKQTVFDFKIDNSNLFSLPAGSVGVAAGLEYRHDHQSDVFDAEFTSGNVFGFGALPDLSSSVNVKSIYAEATVPLLKSLEAELAGRYDSYSVGGSSTTPKLGLKWNALSNLVVRGTYAEGFRAPNFRETSPNVSAGYYNGVTDPFRCINGTEPDCQLNINGYSSGNPNLKPEKSKSYTFGFLLEPFKDASVSVDYYDIKKSNQIQGLDLTYLLAHQADYPGYITRITDPSKGPVGQITAVNLPYINIGQVETTGFDIDARFKRSLGELGKLRVNSYLSFTNSYKVTPLPGSPATEYNGTWDQPRFRGSVTAEWSRGPWLASTTARYTGGYSYNTTPATTCNIKAVYGVKDDFFCHVPGWITYDAYAQYTGIKDLTLGLSITNLFNTKPPFDAQNALPSQSLPYNSDYTNALGRYFLLSANYKFK